ncbi:hypothetical protein HYX19_02680 [Candidatus Woesearchaeota archaeon]|nr:hypothetical protein [Candidatus Woesearchaeota archaeon]
MAKNEDAMVKVGSWSFIAGIVIAVLFGIWGGAAGGNLGLLLVVLGLLVGILNVTAKESTSFLIAAVALILAGNAGLENLPAIGGFLGNILANVKVFVAPAALFVAVKAVYDLAKSA